MGQLKEGAAVPGGTGDMWTRRVLLLLSVSIPLTFCTRMDDTFELPKVTLLYLGALAILTRRLWQGSPAALAQLPRSPLALPVLGYLLALAAASLFSCDPWLSLWGQPREYAFGLLPSVAFAVVFFAASRASAGADPLFGRRLARWAVLAGAAVAAYGLLQYFDLELFSRMPRAAGERVWSTMGNPLYLGAYLMALVPLALAGWLESRGARGKLLWAGCLALFLAVIGLTQSRSAWLGCAVSFGVFYLLMTRSPAGPEGGAFPKRVFLAAAAGLVLVSLMPGVRARLAGSWNFQEGGNAARIAGWTGGLQLFRDRPWLGSGPDTFIFSFRRYKSLAYVRATGNRITQAHAHNDLIQAAATTGAIGLGCYLWILLSAACFGYLGVMRFKAEDRGFHAGLYSALAALTVQNQFNFSTVAPAFMAALLLGLLVGTLRRPLASGADPDRNGNRPEARPWPAAVRIALVLALWSGWAATQFRHVRAEIVYKTALGWDDVRGIRLLERAVKGNPSKFEYRNVLANRYQNWGKSEGALSSRRELLHRALEQGLQTVRAHPYNPDGHNNLGVAYMWLTQLAEEDRREDAWRAFTRAVELDPTFTDAWANLARVVHFMDDPEGEKKLWEETQRLDPENIHAKTVLDRMRSEEAQKTVSRSVETSRESRTRDSKKEER